MMADQITFKPSDIQPAVSTPWNPGSNDMVAEIRTPDGGHHLIHADDLAEAQRRDPNIKVLGQPQAYRDYANRTMPVSPNVTFSTLDIDKEATQKDQAQAASAAAQPGAYQQTKQGTGKLSTAPIRNVNDEAANPFSDTTTSVIGSAGAMMKRPDESDSQFMARARTAGSNVTQSQIDAETASNKKLAAPTLGAAYAAGPAVLSLPLATGAASDYVAEKLGLSAAEDMGLKQWVEQMGEKMPTALDKARQGLNLLKAAGEAHPLVKHAIIQGLTMLGVGKLAQLLGWIGKVGE